MASFHAMKNKMLAKGIAHGHPAGITHSQLFVLAIVEAHPTIGIKEIANKINSSSSAATQLVDGLVASGYVLRKSNAKDRRALQLELSAKGRKHITELKKRGMKTMITLFNALNDKELALYLKLHKKILTKITR